MRIYTGRGDEGRTDLHDGDRVSKTSPRIEAAGTVDEANALLGVALPTGHDDIDEWLTRFQNDLHVLQAEIARRDPDGDGPSMTVDRVETAEDIIDEADAELAPLEEFVLPGGAEAAARLHHARSVVRRAERRVVALSADEPVNDQVLVYLNRLSDALFTLARLVNARADIAEPSPTY